MCALRKFERGNALFLILIAVALFAALSYAITQSGRGGGSIDKEKASLQAAQLLQYGASLENAIQRLMVINGCSEAEISFTQTGGDIYEHSVENTACQLFHADGGALIANTPENMGGDAIWYAANASFAGNGTTCASPSCKDIYLAVRVPEALCNAVNKQVEITGDISSNLDNIRPFQGDFDGAANPANWQMGVGPNALVIADHHTGCYDTHPSYSYGYLFYYVLVAR